MKELITSKQLSRKIFEVLKEVPWMKINGYSAYFLYELSDGSSRDYILLESARNEPFDIFVNDVKALVNIMRKSPRRREIYAYRLNGEEHVLYIPYINKVTGSFDWKLAELIEKPKINYRAGKRPNPKVHLYSYFK
jgi:hypothetical protein